VTIPGLNSNLATVAKFHGWLQHTNTITWATNIYFNTTGTTTNAAPTLPRDFHFLIEWREGLVVLHQSDTNSVATP
jgi:hypothetical protein